MHLILFIIEKIQLINIKTHPLGSKYEKYTKALDNYEGLYKYYKENLARYIHAVELEKMRQTYQYWIDLDPYQFEREITKLFKKNGFNARTTKGSGDGGIDIYVEKQFKKGKKICLIGLQRIMSMMNQPSAENTFLEVK